MKVFHTKKQAVLFFVFAVAITLSGCNQKAKQAKAYHDEILKSVELVIDSSLNFGDGVQTYQKDKALAATNHYNVLVSNTIEKIQKLGAFEGDTSFMHYSLEMLSYYKTTLNNGFKPLLSSISEANFSDEQKQKADSLYQDFAMMEAKYAERFNWAEKKFYKEHELSKVEQK